MEKKNTLPDEHLLDYLDGALNALQAGELEDQISASPELKTRLEELRVVHLALKGTALEMPSSNFTQRVMRNLDSFSVQGLSIRNSILLLSGVLVAIGVALLLLNAGVFDSVNGAITLDSLPVKKQWLKYPLPSIPYNGKTILHIIVIVATGLSFVLLDRTILRPWFENRSKLQRG
jgi:anti-sigma factor RsiW